MAVDFGAAISRGWRYTKNRKRVSILSIFYVISVLFILLPMIFVYRTITFAGFSIVNLLQSLAWIFAGIIIAGLLLMFSFLMFMHNYANQKSLSRSADFAKSRYPRFLAATLVLVIISGIVSIVPLIGIIFSIIVYLIFFFVHQEIAVSDSSLSKSLSNSYGIFKRNKLDIVITLILTAVIGFLIILIFAIPFLIAGFATIFSAVTSGYALSTLMSNIPVLVITGIILIIGMAFSTLFTNSIKTDVYMQIKKKKIK